jgi:hypothetical protein
MHVAVLWVGATIACVAVFRAFGKHMGEVTLLATRAQYRHKSLASHLLRCAAAVGVSQHEPQPVALLPLLSHIKTTHACPQVCLSLALLHPVWQRSDTAAPVC